MNAGRKKLGEMLLEAGLINELRLSAALGEQRRWGGRLGSVLVGMGFVAEKDIVSLIERQLGMKCISLDGKEIPAEALKKVSLDTAKKYCLIPLALERGTLAVAMADPTDLKTVDDLSFILGARIKPLLALESGIKKAIAFHYEGIVVEDRADKSVPVDDVRQEIAPMNAVAGMEDRLVHGETTQAQPPAEKKEYTSKQIIETLLSLLIEKGVITREEFVRKMREKSERG